VFEHGSVARGHAISALQQQGIPFRMSYESPSLTGLVSMVELAWPLRQWRCARCRHGYYS
jgi:hypothetical protein